MIGQEKILSNIENSNIDKLSSLYVILSEICADFSRMTDGYSLATGDKMFENVPDEVKEMIEDRQKFFSYRNVVKDCIKNEIVKIMESND